MQRPAHITRDGKWVLYHRTTGQAIERWPVDARDMLAHGDKCEYTLTPPATEDAPASDEVKDEADEAAKATLPASGAAQLHPLGIPLNTGGTANFDAPTGPVTLPPVGERGAGSPRKLK